jgi:hypothetical protein
MRGMKNWDVHPIEEEAQVIAGSAKQLAARLVVFAAIALVFGLSDTRRSFAGCGGYCYARQARAICHRAVKVQDLEAEGREAEFERCKADPARYLQLQELTDDASVDFE